jgi:hypothetical protein
VASGEAGRKIIATLRQTHQHNLKKKKKNKLDEVWEYGEHAEAIAGAAHLAGRTWHGPDCGLLWPQGGGKKRRLQVAVSFPQLRRHCTGTRRGDEE